MKRKYIIVANSPDGAGLVPLEVMAESLAEAEDIFEDLATEHNPKQHLVAACYLNPDGQASVMHYHDTVSSFAETVNLTRNIYEPEHPEHFKEDWANEVLNSGTLLGYWEWVVHRIDSEIQFEKEAAAHG